MLTSPSYMTDYKVVAAVAECCKESGLTDIHEFSKTSVDIQQLEIGPRKQGFVIQRPDKRCQVTEIYIEKELEMEKEVTLEEEQIGKEEVGGTKEGGGEIKDEETVLSSDLFDLRERANRLSEGLKKLSVMESSQDNAKINIEEELPPVVLNLVKSELEEEKQQRNETVESKEIEKNVPIKDEIKKNKDLINEEIKTLKDLETNVEPPPTSQHNEMEKMILYNVRPTPAGTNPSDLKAPCSSSSSSIDDAILDGECSSYCSSPPPRPQPWLYSYPDFSTRTTQSNMFWQMPFRNKLYQQLMENTEPRRDSAGILVEEHMENLANDPDTDLRDLGSSPCWDPSIFAPTGDIYSYFHRRRLDPNPYQAPHFYSTKQCLGGNRSKI